MIMHQSALPADNDIAKTARSMDIASCPRCGGAYAQGAECGLCAFDRRHPEMHTQAVDEVMRSMEAQARARLLHAEMLAAARANVEVVMSLPVDDVMALELLFVRVAGASVEEVAASVHDIIGDEVDDAVFADIVDRLMSAA